MDERLLTVKCPYCGTEQSVLMDPEKIRPQVALCDIDEMDGCDRYFGLTLRINIEPTSWVMEPK